MPSSWPTPRTITNPAWDRDSGEFSWGFHLEEPHPRGQYNGYMATAEACSPGAMARIYDAPNLRKFLEPSVYGVDFPNVCLSQAYYDLDRRTLVVSMDPGLPRASGQPTTFRVNNVDAQRCRVTVDGQPSQDWRIVATRSRSPRTSPSTPSSSASSGDEVAGLECSYLGQIGATVMVASINACLYCQYRRPSTLRRTRVDYWNRVFRLSVRVKFLRWP